MSVSVTGNLLERLSAFEERPGPSLASQLKGYVGHTLDASQVCWLYVDALVNFLDAAKGSDMGAVFFIEEMRHSTDRHRLWFALVSPGRSTFEQLCGQLERELSSKDPDYLFQYYRSCSPSSALLAQFEASAEMTFRAEDAKPIPGAVVYAWSPPDGGAFSARE